MNRTSAPEGARSTPAITECLQDNGAPVGVGAAPAAVSTDELLMRLRLTAGTSYRLSRPSLEAWLVDLERVGIVGKVDGRWALTLAGRARLAGFVR